MNYLQLTSKWLLNFTLKCHTCCRIRHTGHGRVRKVTHIAQTHACINTTSQPRSVVTRLALLVHFQVVSRTWESFQKRYSNICAGFRSDKAGFSISCTVCITVSSKHTRRWMDLLSCQLCFFVFITYLKLFSKLNMWADVANVLPKDSSVNPLNVLMERLWERLNLWTLSEASPRFLNPKNKSLLVQTWLWFKRLQYD